MSWRSIRRVIASASLPIFVAACAHDSAPRPETKAVLPHADVDRWRDCMDRAFPEWKGKGDVTAGQVIEQVDRARAQDAVKTACGHEMLAYIENVRKAYGR